MISLPLVQQPPPSANCGPCTLCCDAVAVHELGKPFFARCPHLKGGCGIYDSRPQSCRDFRCAWHLGILGERVDRRPDHNGILFQFQQFDGKWHLGIYEVTAGAFASDHVHYLKDIILKSKKTAHLPWGTPAVRFYPWGSDIPPEFAISKVYAHYDVPPPPTLMRLEGSAWVFAGRQRELLMPDETTEKR